MRFLRPAPPRRSLEAVLILLGLAIGPVLAAEAPPDEPKAGWISGPVRYIASPDETKSWKGLKTDADRAKAIEDFWARRDPTPGTPENEFHAEFLERVKQATAQFHESGVGWTTDRGQVLLVAGPPDERTGAGEERETWTYSTFKTKLPAKFPKIYRVGFEKNDDGDYKMDADGRELLSALRGLEPRDAAKLTVRIVAASAAAPAAAAAPSAASAQPGDAALEALRKAVGSGEAGTQIPLETRVRYFMAEGGATRVVVVIAVKRELVAPEPSPTVKLYARFRATETADAQPVEFLDQELFTKQDDPEEGFVQYAFSWPLRKKNYELRTGVAVTAADGTTKTGSRVDTLELPSFKPEVLALSSVTLARVATPAAADAAAKDALAVGSMHLVPWISPVLGPKDDLSFFYDVYGAKRDPASNKPALDLTYSFERKEPDGWKRRGGLPLVDQHEESLGYTIPADGLARWPAGDYRLTVKVKDKASGAEVSSSAEFSLKK